MTAPPRGLDRPATIRIVQPSLAAYRVPAFRELASRPNVRLVVYYGTAPNLANADPVGFEAHPAPIHAIGRGRRRVVWQPIHLTLPPADVAIYLWDAQYASLLPGLIHNRRNGGRGVLWGHGYSRNPSRWRDGLRNVVGRRADAVLLYNRPTAERLVRDHGFDARRTFIAPNAQDAEPAIRAAESLAADPGRMDDFRRKHGLSEGTPLFIQVGRAAMQKAYDVHLAAFAAARREMPNARLAFIGRGYDVPEFEALLAAYGVADGVLRVAGSYDENELAPWFAAATATVFADAIGLSLNHSFSYGVPVITHRDLWKHGPEAVALRDGENALLFERGDTAGLAAAMVRLGRETTLARRLGDAARRDVIEHYSIRKMADGFIDAIRFCVGQPPQAA